MKLHRNPLHRFLFTRDLAQQVSSLFPFLTSRVRASGCCRPDSPLGGGLLRFATVPGIGPDRFFLFTLPHISHASVRRLENGVSPQSNRTFCMSTSTWAPSTWKAFLDRPLFQNLSVSMAFECRADIHFWASGCCRPHSPLGGGLLGFATGPDKCILVHHVDRIRHQEEGTSLRDESVILIAWSAHALRPGSTSPNTHTLSCGLQLPQTLGASLGCRGNIGLPNVTCVACSGFDPLGVQNLSFAFMTFIYSW